MPATLPTTIELEIVTPERSVLTEQVDEVVLPSLEGYMGGVSPGRVQGIEFLASGRKAVQAPQQRGQSSEVFRSPQIIVTPAAPGQPRAQANAGHRIEINRWRRQPACGDCGKHELLVAPVQAQLGGSRLVQPQNKIPSAAAQLKTAVGRAVRELPGDLRLCKTGDAGQRPLSGPEAGGFAHARDSTMLARQLR